MLKKYIYAILAISISLQAESCFQELQEEELPNKACSKTYNNLVVTNALRVSNLTVAAGSTLQGGSTVNGTLNVNGQLFVNNLPVEGGLAAFGSFTNFDAVSAQGTTANVPWSSGGGTTTLSNPANMGFIITATGTGVITIQNPGTYLYNFGVVLQGAGSSTDQTAQVQLLLNGNQATPIGVTTFTIPANTDPSVNFTVAPYELTSSGLLQTSAANSSLALSVLLSDSWSLPAAGNGANAYITLIQVN